MVILTKTFDVLCETQIEYQRFGDDQPINLGWGAKSTQFHGSLGKSAAQETKSSADGLDVIRSPESLSESYQISWRGDGAFFAITCPGKKSDSNSSSRLVKVYSRAGALSSTSEEITYSHLGDRIAWRPDGSIIASSVRDLKQDQLNILFFERNGLQRYGFDLKKEDSIINVWGLAWNADSSILAVGVQKRDASPIPDCRSKSTYAVQLWTRNNYHWYLKHEAQSDLCGQSAPSSTPSMLWHPDRPFCIYFSLSAGFVEMRRFGCEPLTDLKPKPIDTGSVAVMNGYDILLTAFRFQVVPPPMSSCQLSTRAIPYATKRRLPTHVAFSPCSSVFCVLFPGGDISCSLWELSPTNASLPKPTESSSFSVKTKPQASVLCRQITIMEPAVNSSNAEDGQPVLVVLFSETDDSNRVRDGVFVLRLRNTTPELQSFKFSLTKDPICLYAEAGEEWWKVFACGQDGSAHIQTSQGFIKKVSYQEHVPTIETLPFRLPEFCAIAQCIKSTLSSNSSSNQTCAVGLSDSGKLYLNQELVAIDCSSFTTDSDYLILTTFSHQLKFLELTQIHPLGNVSRGSDEPNLIQSSQSAKFTPSMTRAIERGSLIVNAVASSMKVMLQMPRGNLEAIHPRPMVLRSICLDFLKNGKWKEAFTQCRKHKIDFNLLVDFDPRKFLAEGISAFIQQVDNNEHFCLFLSNLKSLDVTTDLYPICKNWKSFSSTDEAQAISGDQKVNTICDVMIEQLIKNQTRWGYINSVLTAMVCKKPPDYKSALGLLISLKSEFQQKVEDAVKYMIFLSDVNELYKFALSMYDLSLVILIAQHSQKDPKEYLPFLQSLRDLNPSMRKFKIDDYLGNFASALSHLSAVEGEGFDAILKYTNLHGLYEEALEIYSDDVDRTKALRNIQGDWLMENNKPVEAGLAFMLAGEIEKSVEGYRQAEAWQEMFTLIIQYPDGFNLVEDARDMASRLCASGRYVEAANILLEYGDDVDQAISALCDSQAFSQAIRTALSRRKPGLITDVVLPAALEFSQSFLDELEQLQEDLTKQVDRLKELKLARETNPEMFFLNQKEGDEGSTPLDGVDAMTEATTIFRTDYSRYTQGIQQTTQSVISSRSGRSSSKSSKMRKKEAKKKASGKKGSVYEEEYLLNTLVKVSTQKLPDIQNTAGSLLPAMLQLMAFSQSSLSTTHDLLQTAKKLQTKLEKLQLELTNQVTQVWDQRELDSMLSPVDPLHREGMLKNNLMTVARPIVSNSLSWKLSML